MIISPSLAFVIHFLLLNGSLISVVGLISQYNQVGQVLRKSAHQVQFCTKENII